MVRFWVGGNTGRITARDVSRGSSRRARALCRAGRDSDLWRGCGSAQIFISEIRWHARLRDPNDILHEEARHKARALRTAWTQNRSENLVLNRAGREPRPLRVNFPEELAEDALPDYGVAGWEI